MAGYHPYRKEEKTMGRPIARNQQFNPVAPFQGRPSKTVHHKEVAARNAKKRDFEEKLRFLKRRHLPNEFLTKIIAEHVEKRLKTNNTDLWEKVNERFQKDPTRRKIFVKGVDFVAKDEEMEMVFSQFGTVERLNLMRQEDNRSKGFGFIMFKTDHGARAAVAAKSVMYKNREMKISAAIPEHLKKRRGFPALGPNMMMGGGQFGGNLGFGGAFPGYGWGYGYGGLYGAVPNQQFGGGVVMNQPWAAQSQPAAGTVQLNAGIQQPALLMPGSPYPTIVNPPYMQNFPQPTAVGLEPHSSALAQGVTFGPPGAYYPQATPQMQTTQTLGSQGQ